MHTPSQLADGREVQLCQLIDVLQQQPRTSRAWRKAMNQLLQEVMRLPRLARSSHPDYGEVLSDTFLQIADRIDEFIPQSDSITASLTHWINLRLRLTYRIKELYQPPRDGTSDRSNPKARAKAEFRSQMRKPALSLDTPIGTTGDIHFGDQLPDPRPGLADLEAIIQQDQAQQTQQQIGKQMQHYIQTDPEGLLRQCHPKHYPNCHCQMLAQRLLITQPAESFQRITKEHGINYHTLYAHWKNRGLPLLQEIAKKMGYDPDREVEE